MVLFNVVFCMKSTVTYILKGTIYSLMFFFLAGLALIIYMTWMPDPDLELNEKEIESEVANLRERLKVHVTNLAKPGAGRNYITKDNLTPARDYIVEQFSEIGFTAKYHNYELYGDKFSNVIIDIPSNNKSRDVLIIGAHYDSIENSPGANDNASGVAALIEIGRYLNANPPVNHNVRLIAFVNEEPPYFQTEEMGSLVYAKSVSGTNEKILGMISLECIGYYTNESGSQKYPGLFNLLHPDTGNFISFIGNFESRGLLTSSISLFRKNSSVPSEGIASPAFVPGIGWSDHWSFWVSGYNAIMVTDTAPYRYAYYHKSTDTPDKLNYRQYAKVVYGLFKMVEGLANKGV